MMYGRAFQERYQGLDHRKKGEFDKFFDSVGGVFTGIGFDRKEMVKTVDSILDYSVKYQLNDQDDISRLNDELERTLRFFRKEQKKIKSKQETLEKAEAKTMKVSSIKGKKKKKEAEKKKAKEMDEITAKFSKLQRFSTYVQQRTKDGLDYHVDKANGDYLVSVCKMIKKYKEFHEKCLDRINRVIKKFDVEKKIKEFVPAMKPKEVVITGTSPAFLPASEKIVFGVDPEVVMKRGAQTGAIPKEVRLMIEYIDNCNEVVGIFRLPGNKEMYANLRKQMDRGKIKTLDACKQNDIASLLKEYARDLPAKCFPVKLFSPILEMKEDGQKLLHLKRKAIPKLTPANHQLFYRLFKMFKDIHDKNKINKMTAKNLGVCWSMNVFQVPMGLNPMEAIKLTQNSGVIFEFIVLNFDKFWPKPPPVPVYQKKLFSIKMDDIKEMQAKILNLHDEPLKPVVPTPGQKMLTGRELLAQDLKAKLGKKKKKSKKKDGGGLDNFVSLENSLVKVGCQVKAVLAMDKKFLLTGDVKGTIKVYKTDEHGFVENPQRLTQHQGPVSKLFRLSQGLFISCGSDKTLKVWKIGGGIPLKSINFPEVVSDVIVNKKFPNFIVVCGKKLIAVHSKSYAVKFEYDTGKVHKSKVTQCCFAHGKLYSICKKEGKMFQWGMEGKKLLKTFEVDGEFITRIVPSKKKGKLAVLLKNGKYATFAKLSEAPTVVNTYKKSLIKNMFELNKKRDYFVMVLEGKSGDEIGVAIGAAGIVKSVRLDCRVVDSFKFGKGKGEDNWFVLVTDEHQILIYNQDKLVTTLEGHKGKINDSVPLLNQQYLCTGSDDGTCRIWSKKM